MHRFATRDLYMNTRVLQAACSAMLKCTEDLCLQCAHNRTLQHRSNAHLDVIILRQTAGHERYVGQEIIKGTPPLANCCVEALYEALWHVVYEAGSWRVALQLRQSKKGV